MDDHDLIVNTRTGESTRVETVAGPATSMARSLTEQDTALVNAIRAQDTERLQALGLQGDAWAHARAYQALWEEAERRGRGWEDDYAAYAERTGTKYAALAVERDRCRAALERIARDAEESPMEDLLSAGQIARSALASPSS
jgi:hypothetical protein